MRSGLCLLTGCCALLAAPAAAFDGKLGGVPTPAPAPRAAEPPTATQPVPELRIPRPTPASVDLAGTDLEGTDRSFWRTRVREAWARLEAARERVASAEAALQEARQRKRPRGDAIEALEQAQAELEAAREALAALPDEARRAGAPPGWLRVEREDGAGYIELRRGDEQG